MRPTMTKPVPDGYGSRKTFTSCMNCGRKCKGFRSSFCDDECRKLAETNLSLDNARAGDSLDGQVKRGLTYIVEHDPRPIHEGGYGRGAKFNRHDWQQGIEDRIFDPGMIIHATGMKKRFVITWNHTPAIWV